MKQNTPLVMGNWKMNPGTIGKAKQLFLAIRTGLGRKKRNVDIAIAPPFPYLAELQRLSSSGRITLGAQDVFFAPAGAHTGEVSLSMLRSVGVSSVIVGHSERRAQGESDHELYQDLEAIFKSPVTAVVCVGETERDQNGNYFSVVEAQLRSAFRAVPKSKLKQLVVAYEPVWAIGTGNHASTDDVREMKLFIQKVITDHFGRPGVAKVRILYGGSVKAKNAKALLEEGEVDGFLIGGASLKAKEFTKIIDIAHEFRSATV
jgi:triosephosphate isomerase